MKGSFVKKNIIALLLLVSCLSTGSRLHAMQEEPQDAKDNRKLQCHIAAVRWSDSYIDIEETRLKLDQIKNKIGYEEFVERVDDNWSKEHVLAMKFSRLHGERDALYKEMVKKCEMVYPTI